MGKLTSFNFVTVNGYFEGQEKGDIGWHSHGPEQNQYSVEMLSRDNILLFGRTTFEFMESYWSSLVAAQTSPAVASGMNSSEKIVFSRTLQTTSWNNSRIVSHYVEDEIKKLKAESPKDLAILGSGSIVTLFTNLGMIDEYQIMIDPIVLAHGKPLFKGLLSSLHLRLTGSQTFNNGAILLCYEPAEK